MYVGTAGVARSERQGQFVRGAVMDHGNHWNLKQGCRGEQHQHCEQALGHVGGEALASTVKVWLFIVRTGQYGGKWDELDPYPPRQQGGTGPCDSRLKAEPKGLDNSLNMAAECLRCVCQTEKREMRKQRDFVVQSYALVGVRVICYGY